MATHLAVKTKEQWKAIVLTIDPSYSIDDSEMPNQGYTAGEYMGWATDAGATWNPSIVPLDVLVSNYSEEE